MADSRRAFMTRLATAAAVGVAPATGFAIEPLPRTRPARMRLSLAAYSFRKHLTDYRRPGAAAGSMTLEQFVDLCAQYGVEGTEPTSYYVPHPVRPEYLRGLRRRAFLQGLTVSGTAIGNTFTQSPGPARDREIAHVKSWVDHAVEMGAPVIRIFAGDLQKGTTEAQARAWCVSAIEECCAYAGERGVMLALENHGGIVATAEQLLAVVRAVRSDWFGVNLDTGNFRGPDAYAELEQAAPYAITVQVKTTVGSPQGHRPADLARVIGILEAARYRGFVALEYEEDPDPMTAVPAHLETLRRLIGG